jgi:hypothetical protein
MTGRQRLLFPNALAASLAPSRAVGTLVIDAEEDFDWTRPVQGASRSTEHLHDLTRPSALFARFGATPTYLVTLPVLQDAAAAAELRRLHARGDCLLGLQLHPWVTPPFGEPLGMAMSFLTNLSREQEERKLLHMMAEFETCFGFRPTIFRAGRYGLSRNTPHLLEKHGFRIDTSLAPRSDLSAQGGPDGRCDGAGLFWFGERASLLEVPLCRDVVGWGSAWAGRWAGLEREPGALAALRAGLLARSRCAERVTLSPEGNDVAAMRRLLRGLRGRSQGVFALSFHSSSLAAGRNPYVGDASGLRVFYAALEAILGHMRAALPGGFVRLDDIPALLAANGGPA